jgi:hypothetical protein
MKPTPLPDHIKIEKQLAIIKNVHCGVGDRGVACLWFDTYISECSAALQVLSWDDAKLVIEKAGVSDVGRLAGRACWVEAGNGFIKFIEVASI